MALNATFKILPIKIPEFGADLTSNLPVKDYWEEEYKDHPSRKKRMSFLLRLKFTFFT